jgi:serine protease AprX
MSGLSGRGAVTGMARLALDMAASDEAEPVLPLALSIPPVEPEQGERWTHYKERVINALGPVQDWLRANAGLNSQPVVSGNTLQANALAGQVQEASQHERLKLIELDPPCIVTTMDDVVGDVELPLFRARHPTINGQGVRVAVLDSGIDLLHPWLQVSDSVSTCGESVEIPGRHGTHVAGSLASRDTIYGGIASGVTLLNIKVLTSSGTAQPTFVTRGVDEALDRGVDILTMSLGFNHLPTWSQNGHGWTCKDGRCQLCMAVENATTLEQVVVLAAAGNDHERAAFLRNNGLDATLDSEISCPGACSSALTVGALTKQTFLTASFSSHGPTSFGSNKPDIAAPGVNITSSIPVRRGPDGQPVLGLTRADLSAALSGTSMATPIVSGVAALIIQRRRESGEPATVEAIQQELLSRGFRHLANPGNEVGVGRLNVGAL